MKKIKIIAMLLSIICCLEFMTACSLSKSGKSEMGTARDDTTDKYSELKALDADEKGYDLPVDSQEEEEAKQDIKSLTAKVEPIYSSDEKGDTLNSNISEEALEEMCDAAADKNPVITTHKGDSMRNYNMFAGFLKNAAKAKSGSITIYQIALDGSISREKFMFDGKCMYMLHTGLSWSRGGKSVITPTTNTRIKEWKFTERGWFYYEVCTPKPPEVTELMNGKDMMRVYPQDVELQKLCQQYFQPIGYQGNNLFLTEWNESNMADLDFAGLYEYLYQIKYQKKYEPNLPLEGISKADFEGLIMEYLPVSSEILEKNKAYNPEKQIYEWKKLGCGNYSPNAFGESIPDVIYVKDNGNNTLSVTINVVCEPLGSDEVFSHEVTIRLDDKGNVQYLGNHILQNADSIPEYQYRLGND